MKHSKQKHNHRWRLYRRWIFLLLVCAMTFWHAPGVLADADQVSTGAAAPSEIDGVKSWEDKIEEGLRDAILSRKNPDILVYFRDKADLSGAEKYSWEKRGQFVYEQLTQTANQSQKRALATLSEISSKSPDSYKSHKSFFSANVVRIAGVRDFRLIEKLASMDEVSRIIESPVIELIEPVEGKPVKPSGIDAVEWGVSDINAPAVWNEGTFGQGIVVANIDTGALYTHDALEGQYRGNLGGGAFDHDYNWFDPGGTYPTAPGDNNGHGTHVMGTMVGDDGGNNQIGVAPSAEWIACKGCATNSCSDADLLACADFILAPTDVNGNNPDPDRRPHVVNNSWGGGSGNTWYQPAVQAWRAAGIFPIFSAGNNGPGCDTLGSPGDYPESFNVAAFDISHNIADFSSRGPSILTDEWKPDVSAPGVNIRSAWPSGDSAYNILNGTSMASPHVAGLVALLWSSSDWLIGDIEGTEAAVRGTAIGVADGQCDFLMEPSSPAMVGVPNPVWGYGRINAYDATLWGDPGIIATPQKQRDFGFAEDVISYPVTLYNLGETLETVSLALGPHQWDAALSASSIDVPAGGNTAFYIYHTVPTGSTIGEESIDVEINWENGPIVVEVSTVNLSVDLQPDLPCPYEGTAFINENFNEGAFPPAGWTVVNNIGSCGWQSGSIAGNQNNTGGTGNFADANSDYCDPQDTELHTPVMDLSGVSEAFLEFKSDFNDYGGNDDGYVDISTNGGTDWTNLLHYEKQDYRGPRTETIDLTPYVGSENTIIRFRYVAPNWDWWWQVDDVIIYYATLPENGAVLCPEATTGKGCPGDGQIHTFSLWNFDPVQDFAMDYFAEAGDISGPGIVFVEADDSADFDITVNLPNLPDGEVIRYEIDAVGMDSGATAWASLDKTIGADEWFLNASMPFAAMDNPVVAYNGKIYAVGGYGAGGQVGIYDPATDTWTTGAIEPSPQIEYPNSAILGYNADGDATITLFPDTTSGVNALHVYNIDTDSWSTPPLPEGFPANGIWAHASVSDPANNVGYITGGASTPGGGNLTSLYRYHPDTHTVEALPVMTSPRDFHAAWLYDGMVCVAGGVNSNSTPLTSTQCFDLATETWGAENTDLPPLPTAQWGMASDTVCGVPMLSLGIIGGNVTTNTIGFDPLIGEWVSFDPAPEPAYRVGGAAIGGDFYVIGGSSGGFSPTSHNRMFLRCCAAEDCCLSVNPSELVLDTWQGSSNGPYACVTVTNACGDELEWNAVTSEAWLEVSPGSGFDGDQACVEYTGSDLGSFEGTLTISATDCTPTSVAVNVDVNVWLPGDCNMDGVVSREEFNNARLMHSGRMPVEPCVDLNNDGIVSFSEFNAVYDAYRSNRLRR